MLNRKPMKLLYLLSLIIFGFTANGESKILSSQAPTANAGPDQTIYLTQTSTVTLNGSGSSGDSYQWTEVSTDYKSGATISSPNSAVTTVTGLPQGVFYFQLAVTSGGVTATDVIVVNVDYDVPPNGTLLRSLSAVFPNIRGLVNDRSDTTNSGLNKSSSLTFPDGSGTIFYDQGRSNDMFIDAPNGKFVSTIEDGYAWNGSSYARTEMSFGSFYTLSTSKTYCFEWKGYFPELLSTPNEIIVIWQLHGNDGNSPPFALRPSKGNLIFSDLDASNTKTVICSLADLVKKANTLRIYIKEGASGAGLVRVEFNGEQKYLRTTGQVGRFSDYPKFATLYDSYNSIVDVNNYTRGKKFSLVTESFKVYDIDGSQPASKPTANAGNDQTITLPTNSINLSGTGSVEGGSIKAYKWTQISGPSSATFANSTSSNTSVSNLVEGIYVFQLKVTDNNGATATSTVQITVLAAKQNSAPKAMAGDNQIITLPVNSITLSGSGSDADGSISAYLWTKKGGPSAGSISNPSSASTTIKDLLAGEYTFELKVTDNEGATGDDTVHISVKAAPNSAPFADAGNNQSITLPTNSVSLSGSGNDDDGTISSYQWTKISGDSCTISDANSSNTTVNNLTEGSYQFQLTVTDNQGATAKDTVLISVEAGANIIPTAFAGPNQTIALPKDSINLIGSGKDSDGTINSYLWSKTNGPSEGTIASPSSASTVISNLLEGEYTFQLKVTDNAGGIGTDTVHVSVKAAINQYPTASAGADKTITLPENSVTLSGSGNDSDGTIASYLWTKISGPAATITTASSAATNVAGLLQGTYQFELKVIDDKGATGKDTVQVSVNAANNIAPTANAGKDQTITLPTNSVTLSGSGADTDGTIASYSWAKVSGPSSFKILNSTSDSTGVTELVQGIYQFELKVTDDKGVIGKDTVQVIVDSASNISTPTQENAAPTANAGKDQIITLPTNTITLSGNGTDIDGTIASYFWTKISGPSSFVISNINLGSTEVTGLIEGTYQFELKVTDDKGAIGKDTVQIKVNQAIISTPEASNVLPVVNAGADITVTLPTNSTILSGTATDSDGTIASYSWTKISGPASFSLINSSSATANVTGMVEGTYQFELKVTDDKGGIQKDTIQVSVLTETDTSTIPKENIAPVVNAGTDQTITLPTNSVTLSGSGSDGGTIASYLWTKVSGPASFSFVNSSSATTNVTGLIEGTYQFELQVIDDKGAIGKDTVQVKVDSAINITPVKENIAPTADAGSDITTVSSTKFITLSGSGNDSDGKIVSYLWTQISGPSSSAISASNTPTIKVRNLMEGTYEFELKVTDDQGATGKDTVRVTVALERTSTDNVTLKSTSLKVYPNPVRDVTTLEVTVPQVNTNIMIVISDINGKTVYTKEFVSSSNYVTQQIDMSNLIKGTYIISVYFDGIQQQSIKVMRL